MTKSTAKPAQKFSVVQFALIFLLVYIASQFIIERFIPKTPLATPPAVSLLLTNKTFSVGHEPIVSIKNTLTTDVVIPTTCPALPFTVSKVENGVTTALTTTESIVCGVKEYPTVVPAGQTVEFNLAPWKYSLFSTPGQYTVQFTAADIQSDAHFTITEPNILVRLFRTIVTMPLLNALVFLTAILPGHSLGWAIIILTLVIKLLLYIPTQSALKGQRKMQAIQPKIDALRAKHKNDPQALNKATLELWRTEKVNPFQSCLPLLIQFPVLLGLFFVIRDGGTLEFSRHLLYPMYQNLPWSFGTHFLGLNLLQPNIYFLPILLVVLQYTQLKLSFANVNKKAAQNKKVIDVNPGKPEFDPQKMQQTMMLYGLPIMIGFFAISFPAAVSIYWAVSTLFAVFQQMLVNRSV